MAPKVPKPPPPQGASEAGPAQGRSSWGSSAARALPSFANALPIVVGMLLLTSLATTLLPPGSLERLFGAGEVRDVAVATLVGSLAAAHPLAGYVLGGELLARGVSLVAVTALLVSWVTVGVVQLPAEALLLGRRFAILRNAWCAVFAIAIAYLTVATLRLLA
jgi:uncharacterized membrane protein YraQ (UPF0718 family)